MSLKDTSDAFSDAESLLVAAFDEVSEEEPFAAQLVNPRPAATAPAAPKPRKPRRERVVFAISYPFP